jgi:quinoprotein glucose dehydrogenase
MYGTPFGVDAASGFLSPSAVPCYAAALGLDGRHRSEDHEDRLDAPNGTIRDTTPLPIPFKMGVPMLGGPMTTAGGVAFYTGTYEYTIRAYDVRNGGALGRSPAGRRPNRRR